jgi:hypothetical protein
MGPPNPQHSWITKVVHSLYPEVLDWTFDTLPPKLVKLLDPNDSPRHISNVVRYWLLHEYGGLWLDYDLIPLKSLTGAPQPWTAALHGRREGCAMWFPSPRHPMMADLIAAALTSTHTYTPHRSGAHLLERVGRRHIDVKLESRVLPIDAKGRRTFKEEVWAVHLWDSSAR